MKCIDTTDAVGHVLCHDITRIVKDVVKDTAFRKGHVVTEEDIPMLLSLARNGSGLPLFSHCSANSAAHFSFSFLLFST